jgi:hypothetical protein
MDWLISMIMLFGRSYSSTVQVVIWIHIVMTVSMRASLSAIGRQLHASYIPNLARSLPSELQGLVLQLVALESGKRGSTERSIGRLRTSSATAVVINRGANRTTD